MEYIQKIKQENQLDQIELRSKLADLKLNLIDGHVHSLKIDTLIDTDSDIIDIKPHVDKNKKTLLLRFRHSKTNTQLLLTDVSPYVLMYFDESFEFKGASFSTKTSSGNFAIQTQSKIILLVKLPLSFDLNSIIKLDYEN